MFSGANGAPESIITVLMLPFLFTFFALISRISAYAYWRNYGKRKPHWWYVYPLFALAITCGLGWMFNMYNPDNFTRIAYMNTMLTKKVAYAHYLSFFGPLLAMIAVILYDRRENARERRLGAQS